MMMICVVITCSVHEDDDHVGDDVKSVSNDKKIAFYLILLEQLIPSASFFGFLLPLCIDEIRLVTPFWSP